MTAPKPERTRKRTGRNGSDLRPHDLERLGDDELMLAHIEGDSRAFGELVRRHEHRLWLSAWVRIKSHDEAKDVVQEALVRGFRFAHTWRGEGSVLPWLNRIVANVATDRAIALGKRQRHETGLDDAPLEELTVGDNASEAIAAAVVQNVVAMLPVDQADCFVRVHLLGFTYAEVSAELKLAEGTVKSRAARGKARLVIALREAGLVGSAVEQHGAVAAPTHSEPVPTPRRPGLDPAHGEVSEDEKTSTTRASDGDHRPQEHSDSGSPFNRGG